MARGFHVAELQARMSDAATANVMPTLHRRRAVSTSTIYCVAAAVIALLTTDSVAQSGTPVKVVGSLDLSGPVADVGRDTLVGIQFAIDTLNKRAACSDTEWPSSTRTTAPTHSAP